jgi:hypothetical protein
MGLLMFRPMRLSALAASTLLALTGCGATDITPALPADVVQLAGAGDALAWGDGPYGLVLLHGAQYDAASWEPQARVFAEDGMRVLATAEVSPDVLRAAIAYLHGEGIPRVAVLAASAAATAALEVGRASPELIDQLIVLSGTGEAGDLGVFPKLFAASEDEPVAIDAERMADEAPGDWNVVVLVPGDAHGQAIFNGDGGDELMEALLRRLAERR